MAQVEYFEEQYQSWKKGRSSKPTIDEVIESAIDEIITEVEMTIGHPQGARVFVAVEGESDVHFISSKLSDNVIVFSPFDLVKIGKEWVKRIVSHTDVIRKSYRVNVIGICDKDYDPLETDERFFYYDHSCLETMIAANDEVMAQATCVYKCDGVQICNEVLRDIKWLSVFRLLDKKYSWNVTFADSDQSPVSAMITRSPQKRFEINYAMAVINERSANFLQNNPDKQAEVLSEYYAYPNDKEKLLDITQGHDFVNCLACYIKNREGKNVGEKQMEEKLIVAYGKQYFSHTYLYQSLREYEAAHRLKILASAT